MMLLFWTVDTLEVRPKGVSGSDTIVFLLHLSDGYTNVAFEEIHWDYHWYFMYLYTIYHILQNNGLH